MKKGMERDITSGLSCANSRALSLALTLILQSFFALKCSQGTGLWVLKSRYDLLEEVKSSEELRETKDQQRASILLHPQCPIQSVLDPAFTLRLLSLKPLPELQVCPFLGRGVFLLLPTCLPS